MNRLFGGLLEKHPSKLEVINHQDFFERDVQETLGVRDFNVRLVRVTEWLRARPESCVLIVGHSAFFRQMLENELPNGASPYLENCAIWSTTLNGDGRCSNSYEMLAGSESLLLQPGRLPTDSCS